jgi:uncharacterized protein (TIGR04442 family)
MGAVVYSDMLNDLRLHGSLGPVDFFAFVSGAGTYNSYFYEEEPGRIRFFARGNEFTITEDSLCYRGTGGSFCEYMFGVEKPVKDMLKEDVLNRLIMFGAFLDSNERVVFTNNTEGSETFSRLFLQGHAVVNYYFLVASDYTREYKKRQKQVLKAVGKFLKRTRHLSGSRDTELFRNFSHELNEEKSIIFIFKLIHRGNKDYYDAFSRFYSKSRELSRLEERALEEISARCSIDRYQQERMKIDVMYRHAENKLIVDEYRDVLIQGVARETIHASEHARMTRLRTLSIRNNIPVVLFDRLDDLLLKDKELQSVEEAEYLKESRAILENLFFRNPSIKKHIIQEDIVRLIRSKHIAFAQNDKGFEQVLLDIGRACDELSRETDDFAVFEELSSIVTYFDRYDNVHTLLSQIAFMKNVEFGEDSLRSLIGNKKAFDDLDGSLFNNVIARDLLENNYITGYGKRKLKLILKGIENISSGESSYKDVIAEMKALSAEEKLYCQIHAALKERMRSFFPGMELKTVRNRIREDIAGELEKKGSAVKIPLKLFEKVFIDLRKESVYLNQILPEVIRKGDSVLREDFLVNSGLDRFYLESIEHEYFEEKKLDTSVLKTLRENKVFF